jgi:hypothetical protein
LVDKNSPYIFRVVGVNKIPFLARYEAIPVILNYFLYVISEDTMSKRKKEKKKRRSKSIRRETIPRCGLCGKTTNLTKTECCTQWICDDADKYVLFSFARNSCYRNHDRYTLCSHHHHEGHSGSWQDCPDCKEDFVTEMYVWRGTNEYNFETLRNPPDYEPTKCENCGTVIKLGMEGFSYSSEGYLCEKCASEKLGDLPW